jgi:uncharacterized membrane protein
MIHIPLNADVDCTDGRVGKSSSVIVDPETLQVSHVVVKEKGRPHTERLVPVDHVQETTPDAIRLDCTTDELKAMQEFVVTTYREVEIPRYSGSYGASAFYTPDIETLPVKQERVPYGEIAIHQGTPVKASDGEVGRVDELLEDPASGQITHFVMREGHVWGDKEVVMPVSAVKYASKEAVQLKLDKRTVSSMLAVPTRGLGDIADVELVIVTFSEMDTASAALDKLATKDGVRFLNAAVLVKDKDGKTSLEEAKDVGKQHGAVFGALTGGLIGMLAGPGGGIVGAVAGAATGRAAAKRIDMGFPDDYLKRLQAGLQPGSSALVVLAERERVADVAGSVAGFEGRFLQHALTEEILAQLTTGDEE